MGRFIRIVKADEEEEEEGPKTQEQEAAEYGERAAAKRSALDSMDKKERAIFEGNRALRPYFKNLRDNPPMKDDEIDYDALYSDIIYANNHMFADLFELDDDARYNAVQDEEGNITTPSIMALPMLTKPVLNTLDKMIEIFGEELGFRKIIDEEDNGSLEDFMKQNRVPNDISAWIRNGMDSQGRGREKQQKGVLDYLKNKSGHPISTSTLKDMDDIEISPRAVRVVPSRSGAMPDYFQQQMDEASAKGREALGALSPSKRFKDDEGGKLRAARKLYEKVLPQVDFKTMDIEAENIPQSDVQKWRRLIENKARENGVSPKDAIPLVQEDLNNYMRIFLQERAIGSAGRGGKFGSEAIAGQGPDFVTPAFFQAAKNLGRTIEQPNAREFYTEGFIKEPNHPTSRKYRMKIADGEDEQAEAGEKIHPALRNALSETGLFREIQEEGTDRQQVVTDRASGARVAEQGGETTVGTSLTDAALRLDGRDAQRFTSSDRARQKAMKKDYRLVDLENMKLFGGMTDAEYKIHYSQVLNDMSGRKYNPTFFSEIPDGADFPEGHPYRDLSAGEIEEKSRNFMDLLVGSGRHLLQFKAHLQTLGMDEAEVEKLDIHPEDMVKLHEILHSKNPYDELERFSDKDKSRYERVLETGVKPGYLNKLNKDLLDLREVVSEIGIDPIDIAEMGMQYAQSGFSREGYTNAFAKLLGSYGKDVSKGAVLRTLYAWKRSNDARAKSLQRHHEIKKQKAKFREHYQMSPEDRAENKIEKEECKACDIKHFAHETKEEAQGQHPFRTRDVSPYALSRVYMPELEYRWDEDSGRSREINLMGDDSSLLSIAAYVFAEHDEDEYIEDMLRKYGISQRDTTGMNDDERQAYYKQVDRRGLQLKKRLKKDIERAVLHPSSPFHHRAEAIGHEFGLDMRDRKRGKRGAARRTPQQRQALGLIHPNAFQDDSHREDTRIRNLTAAQFTGVVEAFDILQDIKSGALTTPDGKRINIKSLTKKDKKGNDRSRKERQKFIASMFGTANASARADSKARRYKSFVNHIQPSIDELKSFERDFKEQYGERLKNGDLSKKSNPEGHAKMNRRLLEMRELNKQDILASINQIKEKRMGLASRGIAGRDYVEISAKDFHLHSVSSDKMKINIGGEENTVVDIMPPKYEDQNYALKLAKPLAEDVPVAGDEDYHEGSELQITQPNHSNKLISFDMRAKHERDALNGDIEDINGFIKHIEGKSKSFDKSAGKLAKNVDYDNHRTEQAFGAFLKVGHLLSDLLGEKDNRTLMNKLSALTTQLYTDKNNLPIPDVFLADGYGDEHRSFMYRPDEYLTGSMDQTAGTGLTHQQNNRLMYAPTDVETLQALSLKQHGRKLTAKELKLANDAFHHEEEVTWSGLDKLLHGEKEAEDDVPQEDIPEGGKMREHQVREMLQRAAYDHDGQQQNWVMNSATGCGLCGGSGKVTLDDAISFIQAHNPALASANPNGPRMQEYIQENLRPVNHGSFDEHHSDMPSHKFPGVACPECDQEHPDAEGGRCSDGMCAHCHGSGYVDPDQVDEYFGGYVDEETGEVFHGHKHSPHYGEHYEEDTLGAMIQERLNEEGVGKTGRHNFTAKMHREAVKNGIALPLTKLKTIQKLNKERYAEKAKIKKTQKDFNLDAYYWANAGFTSKVKTWDEKAGTPGKLLIADDEYSRFKGGNRPIDDAMSQIPESPDKLSALERAHHETAILNRAETMAEIALKQGADAEQVNKQLSFIQKHPNLSSTNGKQKHPVLTACHKLHDLMVQDYPKKVNEKGKENKKLFSLDGDKVQSTPGISHEKLVYNHGRWLTHAENDENIFAPHSNAEPHLSLKDLREMFKHSKPLIQALDRYLNTSDFNQEDAEKVKEIVGKSKKPLVMQKLGGMTNPSLKKLYDEFNAPEDVRAEHEGIEMDEAHPRWNQSLLDEMKANGISRSSVQKYLSVEKEEGESPRGGPRKGLDANFNRAVGQIVKPMYVQFAKLSTLKRFLESYDDISHPNFHKKVVDAMKSTGNTADTRLGVDNFYEITQMRGDLMAFAFNEAARMFGYDDEEDLERSIDLTNTIKNFGGGSTSGLDFKNELLNEASPTQSTAAALPMDIEQLYQDSIASQSSITDEAKANDENIVAQMEEMAFFRHYPNWMRAQGMTNLMAENGYGDAGEFMDAMKEGKVPAEIIEQVKDLNAKTSMFHPTLTTTGYDETEIYDAVAHAGERLQGPATREGKVPMSPSSRPIGQQATVGPQGQPAQMQPSGTLPQQGVTGRISDARTRLGAQAQQFPQRYPQAGEGPVQQPFPITVRQPYENKGENELPPFAFTPPQLPQPRFRQMPEDD
ncbi:MAG: hypothetical protein CL524_12955 [Aequorivita sp.]|nr:hypothetical protein [Aequorivita sp.]